MSAKRKQNGKSSKSSKSSRPSKPSPMARKIMELEQRVLDLTFDLELEKREHKRLLEEVECRIADAIEECNAFWREQRFSDIEPSIN